MTSEENFWTHLDRLLAAHEVVLDRPAGTWHPRYPERIYPFDYGYLKETCAADGDEVDVWAGSGDRHRITGAVCTVDLVKNDTELKLLLGCTRADADAIVRFHDSGPQAALLVWRND